MTYKLIAKGYNQINYYILNYQPCLTLNIMYNQGKITSFPLN